MVKRLNNWTDFPILLYHRPIQKSSKNLRNFDPLYMVGLKYAQFFGNRNFRSNCPKI